MFKGFISEVSIDVGKSAAIMINQLFQWWKSDVKRSNKIYRTNQELHEDLCGVLSIATIQRCKQKLIDKGYIEVSFDKGLNRVTHYSLTEKALLLLDKNKRESVNTHSNKHVSANVTANVSNSGTVVPPSSESKPKYAKNTLKNDIYNRSSTSHHAAAENTRMKESFDEYGGKREGVKKGIPDALKFLLKKKDMYEHTDDGDMQQEDEFVSKEDEMPHDEGVVQDELITDKDYGDCITMMESMECHKNDVVKERVSISSLFSNAFKSPLTKEVENMYNLMKIRDGFVEDY